MLEEPSLATATAAAAEGCARANISSPQKLLAQVARERERFVSAGNHRGSADGTAIGGRMV